MDKNTPPTSHGVFKPVDHVVISFPSAEHAGKAADALRQHGLDGAALTTYTDREMREQAIGDLGRASAVATIGQEVNLVKARLALADMGYHFLVVEAADRPVAQRIAALARPFGAERAQLYGRFVIEDLIQHADDEPQVAESPDRGLDAQTPSGLEQERALRRGR